MAWIESCHNVFHVAPSVQYVPIIHFYDDAYVDPVFVEYGWHLHQQKEIVEVHSTLRVCSKQHDTIPTVFQHQRMPSCDGISRHSTMNSTRIFRLNPLPVLIMPIIQSRWVIKVFTFISLVSRSVISSSSTASSMNI
eukprot:scaffold284394_cov61-Attheya_sp.AAC.1